MHFICFINSYWSFILKAFHIEICNSRTVWNEKSDYENTLIKYNIKVIDVVIIQEAGFAWVAIHP